MEKLVKRKPYSKYITRHRISTQEFMNIHSINSYSDYTVACEKLNLIPLEEKELPNLFKSDVKNSDVEVKNTKSKNGKDLVKETKNVKHTTTSRSSTRTRKSRNTSASRQDDSSS